MYERMLDKHTVPNVENIEEMLGFCGKRLLRCFEQQLRAHYDLVSELKFPFGNNYGWGYKYSHKKQHLCYVFFESGAFTVMTQVGDKKVDDMEKMLLEDFEHDRDGYTQAKTDFVRKYTDIAKEEYGTNE